MIPYRFRKHLREAIGNINTTEMIMREYGSWGRFMFLFGCLLAMPLASACGGDADTAECHGPGRYECGKEGNCLPCCAGLNEDLYKQAGYGEKDKHICMEIDARVFACVSGSCGDGTCEVGESEPCGCVADCPSAVWEE